MLQKRKGFKGYKKMSTGHALWSRLKLSSATLAALLAWGFKFCPYPGFLVVNYFIYDDARLDYRVSEAFETFSFYDSFNCSLLYVHSWMIPPKLLVRSMMIFEGIFHKLFHLSESIAPISLNIGVAIMCNPNIKAIIYPNVIDGFLLYLQPFISKRA